MHLEQESLEFTPVLSLLQDCVLGVRIHVSTGSSDLSPSDHIYMYK